MGDRVSVVEFSRIDIRAGTVRHVEPFPQARKPALKLWIDFGPDLGERKSSAQITQHYDAASLIGRQVVAVVNLPPRQIADFVSEVLVLGFPDDGGAVVLIGPDRAVANGARLI
jgi:tRNA-binding protein